MVSLIKHKMCHERLCSLVNTWDWNKIIGENYAAYTQYVYFIC